MIRKLQKTRIERTAPQLAKLLFPNPPRVVKIADLPNGDVACAVIWPQGIVRRFMDHEAAKEHLLVVYTTMAGGER